MLEVVFLSTGTRLRLTSVTAALREWVKLAGLNAAQTRALFHIVQAPEAISVHAHDVGQLIQLVSTPRLRRPLSYILPIDERGNERRFTFIESYLSTNPFFTEDYALDELDKVMEFAMEEGILDARFARIKLTFHDVPSGLSDRQNAREFIGEELYPRLARVFYKSDRAINKLLSFKWVKKVYTPYPETVTEDYLKYRRRFLEPTEPGQPSHRGRREVTPGASLAIDRYGVMAPSTEYMLNMQGFTPPTGLVRRTPGKLMYMPPLTSDTNLLNSAELERRTRGFPFVAGPSGSMAYDLAVYAYYLWQGLGLWPGSDAFNERLLAFAISRAIAYVKYGHHSFYEALVPAEGLIDQRHFATPMDLYRFIAPYVELGMRSGNRYNHSLVRRKAVPLAVHWDSYGFDWLDWRSYDLMAYDPWTIRASRGGPVGLLGKPIGAGVYIYVVLAIDRTVRYLPTAPKGEQYRSHSQLAGGYSVFAAGYFTLGEGNVLVRIDNSSGHYKPGAESVVYAVQCMKDLGFGTHSTTVEAHISSEADKKVLPWIQMQMRTTARILLTKVRTKSGRTKSFPTPPSELLQYMPY